MSENLKEKIYQKALGLLGNPPRVSGRVIPFFLSPDDAMKSGCIGFWVRSENQDNENELWLLAKEALRL